MPVKDGQAATIPYSAKMPAQDQDLNEEDYAKIRQVIRCLITAASNIRLYPPESKGVKNSIEAFQKAVDSFLARRPAFTISQVGEALLINGTSIDTSDFKGIADGFIKLLKTIGLSSLTFLKDVSFKELQTFITAFGLTKTDELSSEFWQQFAKKQKFSGIFFDQTLYELQERQVGTISEVEAPVEEPVTEGPAGEAVISEIPFEVEADVQQTEDFVESVLKQLDDFILKGDKKGVQHSINRLFQGFAEQTPQIQTKILQRCDGLLKDLDLVSQPQFVEMLTDQLLLVLSEEERSDLLKEMGKLLSQTATNLIQFDDYQRANRLLKHLHKRQLQLKSSMDKQVPPQELIYIKELDQKIQRMLWDDLKSQDPSRMQQTARLLGNLGLAALPLLIEVIKTEDDLRLRQIASRLLGKLGAEAAERLKSELVLEGFVKERVRILEVIDSITKDLETELAYAIGDGSSIVQQAAFDLAVRLNDEQVTSLLLDYANQEESSLAMLAIESLGKLTSAGAVEGLVSILESTKNVEHRVACCKALGHLDDPASIEPLAKIMAPVGFLSFRKKQRSVVRAAAAYALSQMSHPRASEVLNLYVKDRDPRIRRTAQKKMTTPIAPSPSKGD